MFDKSEPDADLPLHALNATATVVHTIDAFPPFESFFNGKTFAEVCAPTLMLFESPACEAYARPMGQRARTAA